MKGRLICVFDSPRGEVSAKVGVIEFGLKNTEWVDL